MAGWHTSAWLPWSSATMTRRLTATSAPWVPFFALGGAHLAGTGLAGQDGPAEGKGWCWLVDGARRGSEKYRFGVGYRDQRPAWMRDGMRAVIVEGDEDLEVVGESHYQDN